MLRLCVSERILLYFYPAKMDTTKNKHIAVIGAGPAGLAASATLAQLGYTVSLVEEKEQKGGHLLQWDRLFPSQRPANDVLDFLEKDVQAGIRFIAPASPEKFEKTDIFKISLNTGEAVNADAILLATGFDTFEASRKEEYGHGIYDHVITSVELEKWFKEKQSLIGAGNQGPKRIGLVHCVGSRDEKVGNLHCSRVCCVTAVKQAIELKEKFPQSEVYCFYMDLRMFGSGYEELYKESQEKYGIQFIRGRLSEAFENPDSSVLVKVEDTLAGKPLKMSLDLLVLMVGMTPSKGTTRMAQLLGLGLNSNGFLASGDEHTLIHDSTVAGVFHCGTCRAPKSLEDTLTDARSAAIRIDQYLRGN